MTPERIAELRKIIAIAQPIGRPKNYFVTAPSTGFTQALDTIEAQAARIAELEAALKPFADVADTDIGNDEVDEDIFRPMSSQKVASSPLLTVGNLRTASTALQLKEPS